MEIKVDEENFHVTIDTTKRYDLYRRKLLDTTVGYCIPVYYDLNHFILTKYNTSHIVYSKKTDSMVFIIVNMKSKNNMKKILFTVLFLVAGINLYAQIYDFSAVSPSGHVLYYKFNEDMVHIRGGASLQQL